MRRESTRYSVGNNPALVSRVRSIWTDISSPFLILLIYGQGRSKRWMKLRRLIFLIWLKNKAPVTKHFYMGTQIHIYIFLLNYTHIYSHIQFLNYKLYTIYFFFFNIKYVFKKFINKKLYCSQWKVSTYWEI